MLVLQKYLSIPIRYPQYERNKYRGGDPASRDKRKGRSPISFTSTQLLFIFYGQHLQMTHCKCNVLM
jgi:hypothetical protein